MSIAILTCFKLEVLDSLDDPLHTKLKLSQYYELQTGSHPQVAYALNGGTNSPSNLSSYQEGEVIHLRAPYKYGYSFDGWYLDKKFRHRVSNLTISNHSVIVFAKWTPLIDNVASVMNYSYKSRVDQEEGRIWLKDCLYGFDGKIDIPGMPTTREDDLLNNYIFSESQCPQGLCFTDDYVLITSYSEEEDCQGELMVFDRTEGTYLVTLGMDSKSHLGGIAFDGSNVWVCNSNQKCLERISYDFIQLMADQNVGEVVDATEVVDKYPVENTPSCITYYRDRLWIATHNAYLNSIMEAYYYDSQGDSLKPLSTYTIPAQVQGVTFDSEGRVYLSTSYGRDASSYIKIYDSVIAMSTRPSSPYASIEMPPGSEEIDMDDHMVLYVIFESAGERYLEGTDGKGKSLCPIDKILTIYIDKSIDFSQSLK